MQLRIPKDYFNQPTPPIVYLCTVSGKKIQELPVYSTSLTANWNSYSELSFEVDRYYTDIITGETKVHPAFDKCEGLRQVLVKNIGYFILQDTDASYSDADTKRMSAFSAEYATASKYLEEFKINKGETDSREVMYAANYYGEDAPIEKMYKLANKGAYDSNEKYYHRVYDEDGNYTYEQIQITDKTDYESHFKDDIYRGDVLYIHGWAPVVFYDENTKELSLLHLIFEKIPEWSIGDVDFELKHKVRSFDENHVSIYDFLTNTVCDTYKCICEWDTINKKVNFYKEEDNGLTEDNTVQSNYDTNIYISRNNLAQELSVKYSADDIKTKIKVTGSDDLNIRDVNLGKNYIINLDFYHNEEWMDPDINESYDTYLDAVKKYSKPYSEAVSTRAIAYKHWNDVMNGVPADGNVVLINDPFDKLYCVYTPIDTAYSTVIFDRNATYTYEEEQENATTIPILYSDKKCEKEVEKEDGKLYIVQGYEFKYQESKNNFICVRDISLGTGLSSLRKQLNIYNVNEIINRSDTDCILLRLADKNSNTITIRIYAEPVKADPNKYEPGKIYCTQSKSSVSDYHTYVKTNITGEEDFYNYPNRENLFITSENYTIVYETSNTETGIVDNSKSDSLEDWILGKITAEHLSSKLSVNIDNYTIKYIGTMGAYFVLAKNETDPANLEDYGVMMLREKMDTYTKIFQTQTENMYSQEKYQCAVGTAPIDPPIGTRWLDTSGETAIIKKYTATGWITATEDTENLRDYKNYQRYLDNYNKLQAVQQVLAKKEKEAQYRKNGYAVSNFRINDSDYVVNEDNPRDRWCAVGANMGGSLSGAMRKAAEKHFPNDLITQVGFDKDIPLYTFICSAYNDIIFVKADADVFFSKAENYDSKTIYYIEGGDGIKKKADPQPTKENFEENRYYYYNDNIVYYEIKDGKKQISDPQPSGDNYTQKTYYYIETNDRTFAVYLNNTTPYIAFETSVGTQQAKMNYYSQLTNFDSFFDEDQWIRLSPLIREDEFNDDNFLLTGYESEEERMSICEELMETASKELKTISQPSLDFSMSMGNILALPEFGSLTSQFKLGNFIRIELMPGIVKRARLLSADLDFDNLDNFSCTFGNLVTTQNQIDLHAELMKQAVNAGKQVATSASNWQKAVDKSNKLEEDIANGLADAVLEVGNASGQSIIWNENGIWGRKLKDGTTDEYEDEQFRLINNKLLFSSDGFKTAKSAFGKFVVDGEEHFGVLSDAVVSGYIEGSTIKGGYLEIGGSAGKFVVSEDGSVQILGPDNKTSVYASQDDMSVIKGARRFYTQLEYTGSTVFSEPDSECIITCKVYSWDTEITDKVKNVGGTFSWVRASKGDDDTWNNSHSNKTDNKIKITNSDIENNAQFSCTVKFNDDEI